MERVVKKKKRNDGFSPFFGEEEQKNLILSVSSCFSRESFLSFFFFSSVSGQ